MIELFTLAVLIVVGGAYLTSKAEIRDQEAKHRDWYSHLWDEERFIAAQDEAEYQAAAMQMQETHEAAHPMDGRPYDITKPMPLPEPWNVVPLELRGVCYRDDEFVND